MELISLNLPKECYPRLKYAAKNVPTLEKRYIEIMKRVQKDESEIACGKRLDYVQVHLLRKENEKEFISTENLVTRNSCSINPMSEAKNVHWYKTLKKALQQHRTSERYISIVITSNKMKDELYKLDECEPYIVHIAGSSKEAMELTKEFELNHTGMNIIFTTNKKLSDEINNLAEKIAYEPLKSAYEILKNLLDAYQPDQQQVAKKRRREVQDDSPSATDKEQIECLCEEILALYEISNVPEQQRPKCIQHTEYLISKEMREDIFTRCPTVEALGFNFNSLQVYVTDKTGMVDREEEIKMVLEKYDVENYFITTLSSPFKELMDIGSTIGAGAKGIPFKRGSIGCYADMKDGQTSKTCILVSRHVAERCSEIYLVENGTTIADVIKTTTEHEHGSLDIAAAQIREGVKVEKGDRQLRDSEGFRCEGRICENSERGRILRKGRKVHIWGSKSKPGYGVITDTQYFRRGMAVSLIQIKDDEGYSGDQGRPFATEGDSGSIVCTDDPCGEHVNGLAMLMGQVEGNYISLPLKDGVEQLETKTNKKFQLF